MLLGISCLIIFREYLLGDRLLIFNDIGSDTWQQYIMIYTGIVNHLRSGEFALWDFTNGLGINVFNFNLFDPFLMLLYGIGVVLGPAHMLIYINVIQILKILAAGMACYWFVSQFSFSWQAKLLAAYVYGLNGFLLVWGQHYQFGTAVIYLPLLLGFCEKSVQKKKGRGFFPVMVFLCGIYSVYFTYMCLAATGLYLIFRILMLEGLTWKQRLGRFLLGCGEILLGIGMSMVIFLPMAEILLGVSTRLDSSGTSFWKFVKRCFTPFAPKYYETLFKRIFSSNLQNGYGMAKATQHYMRNYYEDPVMFCSALSVFMDVQFLAVLWKSDMQKRAKRVLYAAALLIIVGVSFPIGGIVFNYFTIVSFRYTFVLMPVLVLLMAWMWDYLRKGGKVSLLLLAAVAVLMCVEYWSGYEQAGYAVYKRNILILTVTGILFAVCMLVLNYMKKQQIRKALMGVMAAGLAVSMVSEGAVNYENRVTMKKSDTPQEQMEQETQRYEAMWESEDDLVKYSAEAEKPQDFFRAIYRTDMQDCLSYLEENDSSFYRVEKDYMAGSLAMDSVAQGYRGVSTYNSVMNGWVKKFVEACCPQLFVSDQNHYVFWNQISDNWLAAFLGVKYILSGQKELDTSKYRMIRLEGGLYIHENLLDAETAHFYSTAISENSLSKLCTEETRDTLLGGAIALEDGTEIQNVSELDKLKTEAQKEKEQSSTVTLDAPVIDSRLTGSIHAETDGYALFMIPYENGWSLTIDGQETELLRGDIGFLACKVPEGNHTLTLTFQAPGLYSGALVSILCWILMIGGQVFLVLYKKKKTNKKTTALS
ncbi:YfhO family protein [Blautia sp. MSJ-19]|uniref:YfhO family protein n=1 Tax=Blautia sp. MSJ-19 TaxID=2841517 RepID=UPI00209F02BD|nr:YfhO family protein [Blautia sp. MSJ-19]MBU5481070.1 YfhO family protein [Blautia sp. MSJ-19]